MFKYSIDLGSTVCMQAQLGDTHAKWSEEGDAHRALALSHTLHLVGVMVSWRNGSRIIPGTDVVQVFYTNRK